MTTKLEDILRYGPNAALRNNYFRHAEDLLYGKRLTKEQSSLFEASMHSGARVSIPEHTPGKTMVVMPAIGLTYMCEFQGAQIVSISPVLRHAHCQLFPVLHRASQKMGWGSSKTRLTINSHFWNGLPPSEWVCLAQSQRGEFIEGFASRRFMASNQNVYYAPVVVLVDCPHLSDEWCLAIERVRPDVLVFVEPQSNLTSRYGEVDMEDDK